jgi:pectate lyase
MKHNTKHHLAASDFKKTFKKIATVLFLCIPSYLFAQPDFSCVGYATQNGGTTGGKGGQTVSVSDYTQLKTYAESATSYIIMVNGTITNGTAGGQIKINSNKSIIGVGSTAFLSGVGLNIASQNNIIIQNLKITLVGTTTPSSVNVGDCIGISGTSKNLWIDHCEFYSEDPSLQTDKDKYDGLIDVKGQCGFITLSWNYLHDHHKGGLVGSSDEDLFDDRMITMHHNYYNKVLLRIPMYRGSVGHFFNNYIVGATDATEIRANTCLRVEKNYYDSLHYSIYTPSDAPGKAERIDNIEVARTSRAYPSACTVTLPYQYSSVLTSTTADVKTIVPMYAGVGKIGTVSTKVSPVRTLDQLTVSVLSSRKVLRISGSLHEPYTVGLYALDGTCIHTTRVNDPQAAFFDIPCSSLSKGIYIVKTVTSTMCKTYRVNL